MKRVMIKSKDPDIIGSFPALKRAAKAARALSIRTGTPFYIWRDGKVVNLNPVRRRKVRSTRKARSK